MALYKLSFYVEVADDVTDAEDIFAAAKEQTNDFELDLDTMTIEQID